MINRDAIEDEVALGNRKSSRLLSSNPAVSLLSARLNGQRGCHYIRTRAPLDGARGRLISRIYSPRRRRSRAPSDLCYGKSRASGLDIHGTDLSREDIDRLSSIQ